MSHFFTSIWHLPRNVAIAIVTVYQHTLSPDHGLLKVFYPHGCCAYPITCSQYSKTSLKQDGFIVGTLKTIKRIASCHPFKSTPHQSQT